MADMELPFKDGTTSITLLPDDCLSSIFQFLDCGSDRESFGLTCRRWLHVQNTNCRSLQFQCSLAQLDRSSLSQRSPSIDSFHLYRLLTRFQDLQLLSLSGCTELPDSCLTWLQFYGLKLQTLHLDCCFGITDHGLSLVATGCPCLTVISLYRCNVTDIGLEKLATSCTALKNVNLSYCSLISDRGVTALSKNCCQLQAVKISYCWKISGTGFKGCSPTLTYLEANSCKLEQKGIADIVSGGGLEFLNFSSQAWCLHGDSFACIGAGFATRLKILDLRLCRTVGDESIIAIAKGCPLLEEWNLALCHEVRVSGWEAIGLHCCILERLHVNRCRNLCDGGLQALRDGCRRLLVLYMSRCSRISFTAIELFKRYRSEVEIKHEELMCIGPNWIFT